MKPQITTQSTTFCDFEVILCVRSRKQQQQQQARNTNRKQQQQSAQFCPFEMHDANRNRQATVVFLHIYISILCEFRVRCGAKKFNKREIQTEQTIKRIHKTPNDSLWLCELNECVFSVLFDLGCSETCANFVRHWSN